MELEPGRQLPPYRLEARLGEGGMGVVWKARDAELGREAAIKLLPAAFADDPERLARFEREARSLAALSHPNIAAIYGLHRHEDTRYLAMEYVPGEDLAERIARAALPLRDALEIGIQICDALAAAHENGIVHRDLKPANVRLTPAGRVKVLDFGLAKAVDHAPISSGGSDPSISPTLTSTGTAAGVILGTAAYMSPEQARGRPLDRRTDLWALGCVLYEMLTGRQAFGGETISDSLAAVLRAEPDEGALPERTPAGVRRLIRRCLEKDAHRRVRDAGDAALELREALERLDDPAAAGADGADGARGPGGGARAGLRAPLAAALAIAGLLVGAVAGVALVRGGALGGVLGGGRAGTGAEPVRRLSLELPDWLRIPRMGLALEQNLALSDDGRRVALVGRDVREDDATPDEPLDDHRVWVRDLDTADWRALPGTAGALGQPWFVDGGREVLYAGLHPTAEIRRAPASGGGPPSTVARIDFKWQVDFLPLPGGGLALADGAGQSLRLLRAGASTLSEPIELDLPAGVSRIRLLRGRALSDERILAEAIGYDDDGWTMGTAVVELESGATRVLIQDGSVPSFALDGWLTFSRGDTLVAAPFDRAAAELRGAEIGLLSGMRTEGAYIPALYGYAAGTLIHPPGGRVGETRTLSVLPPGGTEPEPLDVQRRAYSSSSPPTVSRDGETFAVIAISDRGLDQIWVGEARRPQLRIGAGFRGADCGHPALTTDGSRIAFTVNGQEARDGLWIGSTRDVDAPQRLIASPGNGARVKPESWSPDGKVLLVTVQEPDRPELAFVRIPDPPAGAGGVPDADGSLVEPTLLGVDAGFWSEARFSPDGRHVAAIDRRRGGEVVVARWEGDRLGPGRRVARVPAVRVEWTDAGDALWFAAADASAVYRVPLALGPTPGPAGPETLVTNVRDLRMMSGALFPDGRLLLLQPGENEDRVRRLDVVTNASAEFRAKLEAGRR